MCPRADYSENLLVFFFFFFNSTVSWMEILVVAVDVLLCSGVVPTLADILDIPVAFYESLLLILTDKYTKSTL